jgi:hypothetical protein
MSEAYIYIHNSNNNGDDGQSARRRYLLTLYAVLLNTILYAAKLF